MSANNKVVNQVRNALPWVGAEAAINILYGFGIVAVVGWLIAPEEFGSASAGLAVVYLIETFSKAGLQEAIIKERSVQTYVTDVGHTASIGLSLVGMLVAAATAFPVAAALQDHRIAFYILSSSIMLPLNALDAIPLGLLIRKMRAKQVMRRQVTSKIVSLMVISAGGWYGLGAWAIILSSIAVPLVSTINIWLMMTRYPRLRWDLPIAKRLILFGITISLELACWNVMSRTFALLFGYFHGVNALGAFQFAFRLVEEVANLMRLIVSRLGLSAFASLHRAGGDVVNAFEKGTRLINLVSTPAFAGLAVLAADIVPVLFGDKWSSGIPYIQLIAVSWIFAMPRILVSPALRAVGRQNLQLWYSVVASAVVLVGAATYGQLSPLFCVIAYVSRQVVSVPWGIWAMRSLFDISVGRQIKVLLPALVASAIMSIVVQQAAAFFAASGSALSLALTVAIGATIYTLLMMLFDKGTVHIALSLINKRRG